MTEAMESLGRLPVGLIQSLHALKWLAENSESPRRDELLELIDSVLREPSPTLLRALDEWLEREAAEVEAHEKPRGYVSHDVLP